MCHQYDKLDGSYFAEFVQDNFENMFRIANKNWSRLFVQDNCPVQNSELTQQDGRGKKTANLVLTNMTIILLFQKTFRQTSPCFKQIFL